MSLLDWAKREVEIACKKEREEMLQKGNGIMAALAMSQL